MSNSHFVVAPTGFAREGTNPIRLSAWLRAGGERRGEDTGQRGQQEVATVHY
jgi:hypothetical protein